MGSPGLNKIGGVEFIPPPHPHPCFNFSLAYMYDCFISPSPLPSSPLPLFPPPLPPPPPPPSPPPPPPLPQPPQGFDTEVVNEAHGLLTELLFNKDALSSDAHQKLKRVKDILAPRMEVLSHAPMHVGK